MPIEDTHTLPDLPGSVGWGTGEDRRSEGASRGWRAQERRAGSGGTPFPIAASCIGILALAEGFPASPGIASVLADPQGPAPIQGLSSPKTTEDDREETPAASSAPPSSGPWWAGWLASPSAAFAVGLAARRAAEDRQLVAKWRLPRRPRRNWELGKAAIVLLSAVKDLEDRKKRRDPSLCPGGQMPPFFYRDLRASVVHSRCSLQAGYFWPPTGPPRAQAASRGWPQASIIRGLEGRPPGGAGAVGPA